MKTIFSNSSIFKDIILIAQKNPYQIQSVDRFFFPSENIVIFIFKTENFSLIRKNGEIFLNVSI